MPPRRTTTPDDDPAAASVSFETVLTAFGTNTGIVVPPELIERLGAGQRPAVSVDLNGHVYRSTVGVMSGRHLVSVSAAIRKVTGLGPGDPIRVALTVNSTPREFDVPPDFAAALRAEPTADEFFAGLSNNLKRYHIDNINGAKAAETRQRRIDRAVGLFAAGKQR